MQSQGDADRIRSLGDVPPDRFTIMGNLKFDLLPTVDSTKRAILTHLLNIEEDDTILTCASTHSGEDQPFIETYLQLKKDFPELKLILAPRHPERLPEIKTILRNKTLNYSVRSQLSESNPNQESIIVLDSIGELLTVYGFTTIAVIGGSFVEKGGQNLLEPLSQGVPVIFGPYMHNFAEICRMVLEHQAGYQVQSTQELAHAITELLTQPEIYNAIAEKGQQLIENNRGAKEIILKAIQHYTA
jgi:3-deoxy-D-manno-octulosonic-acid transferase